MDSAQRNFCIQCGKKIDTSFQTKFCSRICWVNYKKEHSLTVAPERQATVFLKSPLTSKDDERDEDVRIVPREWKPLKSVSSKPPLREQSASSRTQRPANQQKKREKSRDREEYELLVEQLSDKDKEIKMLRRRVREVSLKNSELQRRLRELQDHITTRQEMSAGEDLEETVDEPYEDPVKLKGSVWRRFTSLFKRGTGQQQ